MADKDGKVRIERDTMGEVKIPAGAYYGAQTQRAVENFPVSGIVFPREFIRALGLIKKCAAQVNSKLQFLDVKLAKGIVEAANEVERGDLDQEFVLDIFQTGSGTSTNMNANEVIATRANEILSGQKDTRSPVHPNDHVNMGQSSNDVIPTAIHVAALTSITADLVPALKELHESLKERSIAFDGIVKIGRTHLQDAVPIRLGQEFSGYARQVELDIEALKGLGEGLGELALGGTAVGTGLNCAQDFAFETIELLSRETGCRFTEARNHFAAQASQDAAMRASGVLKSVSGPRCGIGEINIPAVQPGSSIMPGKVNPVIPESVTQVAAHVMGNDAAIAIGCQAGNFELNVMLPVIAHNLLQSIKLLGSVAKIFSERCVKGISANEKRCEAFTENSLAMCTTLAPVIGHEKAAAIAKKAYTTGKTVREVAMAEEVVSRDELDRLLDPVSMT
ncbi:MAG: class II fumarate hydratase [Deltaproteobacteria bacterium]|nr:class II fumarate hydratase [Deltaproteobacteria bacterium]